MSKVKGNIPTRYTSDDGTVYQRNPEKNIWLPIVDDQLLKQQQEIYSCQLKRKQPHRVKKKKKAGVEKPFVEIQSKNDIYIENLPTSDFSYEEFLSYFSKVGIIKKDFEAKPKAKLYLDETGKLKGDGLITYYKEESVQLALDILDDTEIKPGYKVRVTRAVFKKKSIEPGAKKQCTHNPKSQKVIYDQSKELGWEEDSRRHCVLKNVFSVEEAKKEVNFFSQLQKDLEEEFMKFGNCERITIFERNPEGVVVVIFKEHLEAKNFISIMNGRYFDGRKIAADFYDGFSNFYVAETEEDKEQRIKEWEEWLDKQDEDD